MAQDAACGRLVVVASKTTTGSRCCADVRADINRAADVGSAAFTR